MPTSDPVYKGVVKGTQCFFSTQPRPWNQTPCLFLYRVCPCATIGLKDWSRSCRTSTNLILAPEGSSSGCLLSSYWLKHKGMHIFNTNVILKWQLSTHIKTLRLKITFEAELLFFFTKYFKYDGLSKYINIRHCMPISMVTKMTGIEYLYRKQQCINFHFYSNEFLAECILIYIIPQWYLKFVFRCCILFC